MATAAKGTRRKGAKTIAREYFAALGAQDLDAATALWRDGGRDHLHGVADLEAPSGVRSWFAEMFAAFPDFELEVLDVVGDGELAAVRWQAVATFIGPGRFQGIAPTGARVTLEGCDMLRIEDEEIVENHAYINGAHLAQQLGLLPARDSAGERAMTAAFNARTAALGRIRALRQR